MFRILRWLFGSMPTWPIMTTNKSVNEMNEGDFHSGPDGYSPNSAYLDTHCGHGEEDDRQTSSEYKVAE